MQQNLIQLILEILCLFTSYKFIKINKMSVPSYVQNPANVIPTFPNLFSDLQCNTLEVENSITLDGVTITNWQQAGGFNSGFFILTENQSNTTSTAYYRIIGTSTGNKIAFVNITGLGFNYVSGDVILTGVPSFLIPTVQNQTSVTPDYTYYYEDIVYPYTSVATINSDGTISLPNINGSFYFPDYNPISVSNFTIIYFL